jgi:hypothetical protein
MDPHFFGLGIKKVLSRNQAVLQWRDPRGGQLIPSSTSSSSSSSSSDSWIYQPPKTATPKIIGIESLEQLPQTG